MKVIFLEDVTNVAKAGEIKEVAVGYARNYLMPKKLASVVTAGNLAVIQAQVTARAKLEAKTEAELAALATLIESKEVVLKVKTGGKDRMYGSITTTDIAAELEKSAGIVIDKRKIQIAEPIKTLGTYELPVALGGELNPKLKVSVVKLEAAAEAK
jgi:large subunit ribosomal protein L9